MFERRSALADAMVPAGRDGPDGKRRLLLGEARHWSLVQVAAFATTLPELQMTARSILQTDLPDRVGAVVRIAGCRLLKTGAEQFWIIAADRDDRVRSFSAAVTSGVGAVTPLSHSRTCIFVEGGPARDLLAKGIALDLHPEVFGLDRFAMTGLHHTPVLVHRSGQNRYELYAMRTFARSVWDWLIDAALPDGYDIVDSA